MSRRFNKKSEEKSTMPKEQRIKIGSEICIDFRDLNKATPMDGYPMPIANMLVDVAAEHKVISFMDGNACYNQFFMAEEDIAKNSL